MAREILINVESKEKRAAVVSDGRLEEFYVERPQDKTIVGNIYKGKIEAVLPSIGAAFVNIGLSKNGFLYLSEIEDTFDSLELPEDINRGKKKNEKKYSVSQNIKKGQEVLVQVVKEAFGTKGPRLSCHIGIAGRYIVLMPQDERVGVSRRVEDDERRRLKTIFSELNLPKDVGFIVRTAACGKTKQELFRDAQFLLKLWQRIKRAIQTAKAPDSVYAEYDLSLRVIRDSFTEDVSKLIVDSKAEYYRIKHFMRTFLNYLSGKLELYRGEDLFEAKGIEQQINRIFESKIYLKSKAYIIIEPTEGLVVIDVNSGGFRKIADQEESAFKVNCEAALEVARQLRLRDLGGIIVIDFIDMLKESHRRELLNILKVALAVDRAKYDILGISKFGLVEMTRERIHNTVEMLSYQPCPHCQGKGKVKSPLTMSIYAFRELRKYLSGKRLMQVNLTLNPAIIDEILKDKESLRFIERKFKTRINLISEPSLNIEEIKIS